MKKTIYLIIGVAVIGLMLFFIFTSDTQKLKSDYVNLDQFAQCLASKNLTMYGAAWCTHCKSEKDRFGDSFQYVKYVECPENEQLCLDKDIRGYPTWIDDQGNKYEGEQGLEKLSEISGCVLEK